MISRHARIKQTVTIIFFSLFAKCLLLPIEFFAVAFTPVLDVGINSRREVIQSASGIPTVATELVSDDDSDDDESDEWMSDMERAKRRRESRWKPAAADTSTAKTPVGSSNVNTEDGVTSSDTETQPKKRLTYTAEEEDLIETLGGKDLDNPSSKREPGFLGDCTLKEIAFDFQIPICYLADVICGWGVQAPIDPDALLGDMVTGEQAFAILEAIHTLEVGALNDRYADYDLMTLCNEYDVDIIDGYELAVKEGWNLPFGVRTFLRVEQENDFIRILAKDYWS